jgi:hypothetical protein
LRPVAAIGQPAPGLMRERTKMDDRKTVRWTGLVFGMLLASTGTAAAATQSDAASRHSEASLAASVEVPVAVAEALSAGAAFSVTALEASGGVVALTISAVGVGTSAVVRVSAEIARALGIAVGTVVVVTAVSAGWILSVAGESLCFVANELARPHLHSRRLSL